MQTGAWTERAAWILAPQVRGGEAGGNIRRLGPAEGPGCLTESTRVWPLICRVTLDKPLAPWSSASHLETKASGSVLVAPREPSCPWHPGALAAALKHSVSSHPTGPAAHSPASLTCEQTACLPRLGESFSMTEKAQDSKVTRGLQSKVQDAAARTPNNKCLPQKVWVQVWSLCSEAGGEWIEPKPQTEGNREERGSGQGLLPPKKGRESNQDAGGKMSAQKEGLVRQAKENEE